MSLVRRLLLLAGLALILGSSARAAGDEPLVIVLEHHWVVEVAGERFGLIQFDTPMTTLLCGRYYFDLPVPAFAVLAPVLVLPALAAVGVALHSRRRRLAFAM